MRVIVLSGSLFVLLLTTFSALPADASTTRVEMEFRDALLKSSARALPMAGQLRLEGLPFGASSVALELERFRVFATNARIVLNTDNGPQRLPIPKNAYFRGQIEGDPRSRAVLSFLASGEVRGLVASSGRYWMLGQKPGEATLKVRELDAESEFAEQTSGHSCSTDQLPRVEAAAMPGAASRKLLAELSRPSRSENRGVDYTATIAYETDNEFLSNLFGGNTTSATDYIGDLTAYGSTIYSAEVDTSWQVGDVTLWQTTDPWNQFSTICGLFEFGRYWNDNNTGITRTLSHFLSGKNNGGGVAWVGVLCNSAFDYDTTGAGCSLTPITDNYGGDYGYSGDLDGNFDINNPSSVWDIVVVTHEIGHNFNSPHGHCYENIGGNAAAVDNCNSGQCGQTGCFCGTPSLPCPTAGAGCGTIMSYCHLLSGGLGNISLTLGLGHPWGVAPERIPNRMRDHVIARAASNPGCLDTTTEIFRDDFESGNTSAWTP